MGYVSLPEGRDYNNSLSQWLNFKTFWDHMFYRKKTYVFYLKVHWLSEISHSWYWDYNKPITDYKNKPIRDYNKDQLGL